MWCSPGEKDGGAGGIPGSCHSHPGQELVQGGLGNVNKGKLGGKTARASGVACHAADRAQPVRLLPRLSWAQEGALEAHPSRSIRRTCLAAQGPRSLYFFTLLCPASQSFQGRGTSRPQGRFSYLRHWPVGPLPSDREPRREATLLMGNASRCSR